MTTWESITTTNSGQTETHETVTVSTQSNTYPGKVTTGAVITAGDGAYTGFHLSAITFLYPPSIPTIKQCPCDPSPAVAQIPEQNTVIRVYHTEPSDYSYNRGSYLIRESRFSTPQQWHAPSDDLVADDAAPGSPVAAIGWWADISNEIWETRIYYVDINGTLRERTNHSYFAPQIKDDFDAELPKPEKLVPPTPGWKVTPTSKTSTAGVGAFPDISPLAETKLAAVRSEDGAIYVFYQAQDNSVSTVVSDPGRGWSASSELVVSPGDAKVGTPLTVVSGGWAEVRLFFVAPDDHLQQTLKNENTVWSKSGLPFYKLPPTAMLSAVAWNFASPNFGIRVYTTDDKDELYEYSFNRKSGGWAASPQSLVVPVPRIMAPGDNKLPLSAVAAVIVDPEWRTKVYFHPRRIIAEWDVCSHTLPGIGRRSESAEKKRELEEQTRVKIEEEKERQRQEEERKRKEEEQKRQELERQKQEEERKRREAEQAVPRPSEAAAKQLEEYHKVPQGGTIDLSKNPELDQILKKLTNCTAGYQWKRTREGWVCEGGGHKLTNAQFDALSRKGH